MLKYIVGYLWIVNFTAFIMYGIDKKKAVKGEYRISEKMLLLSGAVGGSIGAMIGMKVFHHKTRHKKFVIGLPLIFVLQCLLIWWLWKSMA